MALDPRGYVVVGAHQSIPPIFAFSTESDLDLNPHPGNALRDLLFGDLRALTPLFRETAEVLSPNRPDLASMATESARAWNELLLDTRASLMAYTPTNILVPPMLSSQWAQWRHYNAHWPGGYQ